MPAEPWVSVEDVARHVGVSHDSVYRWIDGKGLPAHKVGHLWKTELADVDEWVRIGGAGDDPDKHLTLAEKRAVRGEA